MRLRERGCGWAESFWTGWRRMTGREMRASWETVCAGRWHWRPGPRLGGRHWRDGKEWRAGELMGAAAEVEWLMRKEAMTINCGRAYRSKTWSGSYWK